MTNREAIKQLAFIVSQLVEACTDETEEDTGFGFNDTMVVCRFCGESAEKHFGGILHRTECPMTRVTELMGVLEGETDASETLE